MAAPQPIRCSAIYAYHLREGATLHNLHGWRHPLHYRPLDEERALAHDKAVLVDISPTWKLDVLGVDPVAQLKMHSSSSADMCPGELRTIYPVAFAALAPDQLFVRTAPEASDTLSLKLLQEAGLYKAVTFDVSAQYTALALVGPKSPAILSHLTPLDLAQLQPSGAVVGRLGRVSARFLRFASNNYIVVYEIYVTRSLGEYVWELILNVGRDYGLSLAGFNLWQEIMQEG